MIRTRGAALFVAPALLLASCGASPKSSAPRVVSAAPAARLIAAADVTGSDPSPDSGLRGRVLYGPTCPVQRIGESCVRPYQATLSILREPTSKYVATVRSTADGRFTVRLSPGRYLVKPRAERPYPKSQPQTVTVHAHRFTDVTITYDSGIR